MTTNFIDALALYSVVVAIIVVILLYYYDCEWDLETIFTMYTLVFIACLFVFAIIHNPAAIVNGIIDVIFKSIFT